MLGYHGSSWSGGGWLAMSGMFLFWVTVIALVVWAVRSARDERPGQDTDREHTTRPDDILAQRYARGEIEEEEFRRRRELLHTTSGHGTKTRSTP